MSKKSKTTTTTAPAAAADTDAAPVTPTMRAKLRVVSVETGWPGAETLHLTAVGGDKVQSGYPADGCDEDNDYARWSPQADFTITINNPNLHGKFKQGDKFYVDFTRADQPAAEPAETQAETSETAEGA